MIAKPTNGGADCRPIITANASWGWKMTSWVSRIAAIAAVVLFVGAADAQQFTMKLSSPTINDAPHEWMKMFKAGVEQRSGACAPSATSSC